MLSKCSYSPSTSSSFGSAFPQTTIHGEFSSHGTYLTINYHVLVSDEDQGQSGDVYIGARFKSNPDEVWLLSGGVWRNSENTTVGWPTSYVRFDDQLPPIVRTRISYDTESASTYGEGEIWVGYGLRLNKNPTPAAFQESFAEMVQSKRYSLLWELKENESKTYPGVLHGESSEICLNTTQMVRTVFREL